VKYTSTPRAGLSRRLSRSWWLAGACLVGSRRHWRLSSGFEPLLPFTISTVQAAWTYKYTCNGWKCYGSSWRKQNNHLSKPIKFLCSVLLHHPFLPSHLWYRFVNIDCAPSVSRVRCQVRFQPRSRKWAAPSCLVRNSGSLAKILPIS